MESIFHEKQEGSLCAQHCLNNLLQGSYFTAVDLAELGQQLDESEREHMTEAGISSDEYRRFMEQPSSNYDDSGFFSIQVLQNALRVWNLELLPYRSADQLAVFARQNPRTQQAYICNFREHWFTVRRLGNQWFNLNSLLTGPELISDTYLAMFLAQLETEGYSIFIVVGQLLECEADELLKLLPAVQPVKPRLLADQVKGQRATEGQGRQTDAELQRALDESRKLVEKDDAALQQALALSIKDAENDLGGLGYSMGGTSQVAGSSSGGTPPVAEDDKAATPSVQELREKRQAFLSRLEAQASSEAETQSKCAANSKEKCMQPPIVQSTIGLQQKDVTNRESSSQPLACQNADSDQCAANHREDTEQGPAHQGRLGVEGANDATSENASKVKQRQDVEAEKEDLGNLSEEDMLDMALKMSMEKAT